MAADKVSTDLRFSIVPEWVLDSDLSDKALRIYVVLARYADSETLECFPSLPTIAKRARCSKSSVIRALDDLEKHQAIVRRRRVGEKGFQSTVYVVRRQLHSATSPSVTHDTTLVSPVDHPSVTHDTLTITTEREPSERDINTAFAAFWDAYPRKRDKGHARKAFEKALKKTSFENILTAVERYKAHEAGNGTQYIAYPATWLNGERWDDDFGGEVSSKKRQPNYVEGVRLVAKYQAMEVDELE